MTGRAAALARQLGSLAAALAVGAALIALTGGSPGRAYLALLDGAFGSVSSVAVTLQKTAPLVFTGLSVAFAFRAGLLNIGAEGQLYMGALASVLGGIHLAVLPPGLHAAVALTLGLLAGAAYGAGAGYLKARRGVSEIISTIMLNFLAIFFVSYLVQGPVAEPPGYFHQTAAIAPGAALPPLLPGAGLSSGIVLAVAAAVLLRLVLWRTPVGFLVRAVGHNPVAARFAGMSVGGATVVAMAMSGAMAGLAGAVEILGEQHRLLDFFSPGYGFDGIAVAFLGRSDPLWVILAALFFAALRTGANQMQRVSGMPVALVQVLQALVIVFVLAGGVATWRRERASRRGAAGPTAPAHPAA
jgi:simple sugar transport system permease protein